jgi:uncharacterized caspase-like protein
MINLERWQATARALVAMLLLLLALPAQTHAAANPRHALVIGNNDYATLPDLNNAARDARDMAAKLGELGFKVTLQVNADRGEMFALLADFSAKLVAGGTGLVFYAGHGIAFGGVNYLIPVEAPVRRETDVEAYGVPVPTRHSVRSAPSVAGANWKKACISRFMNFPA